MPFCLCSTLPGFVYACAGASESGALADQAARWLDERGTVRMGCLAGIAARSSGAVATAQTAARVVAIDGCAQDCARRCLEQAGIAVSLHLRLSDLPPARRTTPPQLRVRQIGEHARRLLLA